MIIKPDCRYYRGEKPCAHGRLCDGCALYEPCGAGGALIIKTGALGDVLRTTCILPALRAARPGLKITWITSRAAAPLLEGNPNIDTVAAIEELSRAALFPSGFDMILSLDKTPAECALATVLKAREKRGIGLSEWGTVFPFNQEAEYYFSLGLSDELKFRKNEKTYPELIYEVCGLEGEAGPPELFLSDAECAAAQALVSRAGTGRPRVGLVVGAGDTFANKTPSAEKWAEVIKSLGRLPGGGVSALLLGGPEDEPKMNEVAQKSGGAAAIMPPTDGIRVYAAALGLMDAVICGDTLALHIAAALRVPAVALFGPTCPREVGMFGAGVKLVTPAVCAPCYRRECPENPNCMDLLGADDMAAAAAGLIGPD